jgi:hypothetical protein
MRRAPCLAELACVACLVGAAAGSASASSDPYCLGSYGQGRPRAGAPLRFGIDPGLAGSAGGVQLLAVPDDPARDLTALRGLRPAGRQLVVRLNRLFWSQGQGGVVRFQRMARAFTRAASGSSFKFSPKLRRPRPCASWYRPRATTRAPSTSPTTAGSTSATRPRALRPRSSVPPSPPTACYARTTPPSRRSAPTAP